MSLSDVLIAFGSLVLSVVAFISASRANTTAKQAEVRKVDAEAYQRAQHIYTEALGQLRRQNEEQEATARRLSQRVALLEAALHAQGIPLPADPSEETGKKAERS